MKVMVRAGTDKSFRNDCLGLTGADSRTTIQNEAGVTFDSEVILQCFPNREAVENQIVLQFPDEGEPVAKTDAVKNFWLCTYVDYIPAKPPAGG